MLLAAPLWPSSTSKSTNPCSACHGGANNQYLDILEGDAGNTLPSAISDAEVLAVAVVIEVTGNTALNNIMSGITAKLVSQNGFFSVDAATYSVGTLANGQKATAFWNISALSSGSDVMVITAAGANTHKNRQFSDSYSPSPAITVTKTAADLPPSIALTAPAAGQTFSGGSSQSVAWTVTDEDRATCQVGLYYSTDNFASSNVTIATGLPAAQGYSWTTPLIDSTTVRLKATVTDKSFKFNQSVQAGTFAIDSTAPTVLSVQPADGAADVPASTMLQAQFSEPVAASAAQAAFSIAPDPGGVVWGWDAGRTTMTAAHDAFADGTTYTCTLSTGVKDLSSPGNGLQAAYTWSFTTPSGGPPAPAISLQSPAGGERLYWGDPLGVRWSASGGAGALAVNLSISADGPSGIFSSVATALPNGGLHTFAAPNLTSDICVLRATVYDQNGQEASATSAAFSIARPLALSADLPAAGARLRAGSLVTLNWTGSGGHGAAVVSLSFQPDPGSPSQTVLSGQPLSGSTGWTVPAGTASAASLTVNATDGWGRSVVVQSGLFVIFSNIAPRFTSTPVTTGQAGSAYAYAATAADDDLDALTFSVASGPSGLAVNATTGRVAWTPAAAGNFTVTLAVSDGKGGQALQEFTIRVNPAPVIVKPTAGFITPSGGEKVKGDLTVTGVALKGSYNVTSVQYRIDSGPWMNATGSPGWQFTLDTKALKNGNHTIEVRAFDGTNYSDTVSRTISVDNQKARSKVSIPMLDGWVVLSLLATAGLLFYIRRK
jgi:hypothetical protein